MGKLETKVEIDRIRTKLNKLSWLGQAGYMDYNVYIDSFLRNGKLDYLNQCLDIYFDINTSDYPKFDTLKINAWNRILQVSRSPFLESLSNLYKRKEVFQIGNEIRSNGGAYTFEISDTLDESYSVVATQSKIGVTYQSGNIVIGVLDPNTHSIDINSVTWATYSIPPTDRLHLQSLTPEPADIRLHYVGSTSNSGIPDMGTTINTVHATASVDGTDVIELNVDIRHTYVGDLQINLVAPNGRIINAKRQGGPIDNGRNINVTYTTDNSFKRLLRTPDDNTTGKYRMDKFGGIGTSPYISDATEAKQLLTDNLATGTWSLVVNDVGTGNTGSIASWSLDIVGTRFNDYLQAAQYVTQIPTLNGGTYLLTVVKKSPFARYNYRVQVNKYDMLGTITEIDATELVDANYYVRSRKVAQVTGTSRIFLEVTKTATGEVRTFMSDDPNLSEEGNLYERYEQAINFLKS